MTPSKMPVQPSAMDSKASDSLERSFKQNTPKDVQTLDMKLRIHQPPQQHVVLENENLSNNNSSSNKQLSTGNHSSSHIKKRNHFFNAEIVEELIREQTVREEAKNQKIQPSQFIN